LRESSWIPTIYTFLIFYGPFSFCHLINIYLENKIKNRGYNLEINIKYIILYYIKNMPSYNIATFSQSHEANFTVVGVTYTLTPSDQTSAPFTYHSDPDQTSIPISSFDGGSYASSLLTFTCGDNVTIIDYRAFVYCNLLTSMTLSNVLTTIGYGSLSTCEALSTITIPASVTDISAGYAFIGDSALKDVYFLGNLPILGGGTFSSFPIAHVISQSLVQPFLETGYFSEVVFPPPYPCFKEGSRILTIDGYVPVERLRKGDLIQTLKNSYLPIVMIGKSTIYNSGDKERIKDRLYTLSSYNYPDLTEDLVLTGCHSVLMDKLTKQQENDILEKYGEYNITDGKVRLETYMDSRSQPYKKEGNFTIYHLALENENYFSNYGIWANGLLVESCSKRYLTELSNMKLLN